MSVIAVIYGFLAPAAFAVAAMLVLRWLLPAAWASRLAGAVALVGGFVVGYALLGSGQWLPKFHWHWLPYVVLGTLVAAPLVAGDGKLRIMGSLVALATVGVAAWLLTPAWPHLEPSRTVYIAVWTPIVFAVAMLLDPMTRGPISERLPCSLLETVLAMVMFAACIVIFLSGSARFTQIAGAAAGAMIGIAAASPLTKGQPLLQSIAPSFAMLIGSLLLIAQADSHSGVPLASYLLIPLAPLALWIVAIKPPGSLRGWKAWLALPAVPLVLLVAALALAVVAEPPW